jgi:hypothetical protein
LKNRVDSIKGCRGLRDRHILTHRGVIWLVEREKWFKDRMCGI